MVRDAASLAKLGFDLERPTAWPLEMAPGAFAEAFPAETEVVEFKQGLSALQASIVAFSNSEGGVIIAGVRDSGEIVGLPCTPATVDRVTVALREVHSPGPTHVRSLRVGDREVTVIGVARVREGFAQTSQGQVLARVGTQRPALIGSQLVRFMHERMASRFETMALDVRWDAVDEASVARVAEALGLRRGDRLPERMVERGLVALAPAGAVLTVAGALYLLPHPERVLGKAYIEIMRFPAGSHGYDRREEITGPLDAQVEEATRAVQDELGADHVVLGLRRHELPRLPERVVRETIANAVAHRSYEQKGTAVRIEIRPDRVTVTSPGGLVPPVTVETMRDQHAARNNGVIRILRGFGLAEDSGKGVDMIEDLMRDELLAAPAFAATESSVTVELPVLSGTSAEERAWVREVEARGSIEERDRVLLVHARRGEILTNQRARELLNVGRDAAMLALRRLVAAGLLERSGTRGGTRYRLAGELAPPAGLRLSREELAELVLHLADDGPVTNQRVRRATGLDRQDTLTLLDELVRSGRLARVGERRGTRYLLTGA